MFSWKGTKSTQKESKLEWNEIKWKMKPGSQNKAFFIENTSSRKTFSCSGNVMRFMHEPLDRVWGYSHSHHDTNKSIDWQKAFTRKLSDTLNKMNLRSSLCGQDVFCDSTVEKPCQKKIYSYRKSNLRQKMERRNNNNKTERNFFSWNQSGRSRAGEKGTSCPPE